MPRPRFEGIYLPHVTPFREGKLDREVLAQLVEYLIGQGATGLAPCGTTGESATLSHAEHYQVVEQVVKIVNGRVPVIAGAGSNSTEEAIGLAQAAERAGADALLVISPYYNRPNQAGIIEHYRAIARATRLPIIMYNIPRRTAMNMAPETIIELSKVDNIVGVKEASGDLHQIMEIIQGTQEFSVLSGEDDLLFTMCCLGAQGGITASAHIVLPEWLRLYQLVKEQKLAEARALHYRLLPLVRAMFCEPNPAPAKAACELIGIPVGPPRLPLLPATEACRSRLREVMTKLGAL